MISHRHWIVLLLAGRLWLPVAFAQETAEPLPPTPPPPDTGFGGVGSTPSPGASSSFGSSPGASSSFSTTPPSSESTGFTAPTAPAAGADSGLGAPAAPADSSPSFTLPGFYGGLPSIFTAGQGRLARPKFRTNVSLSQGYDDNVLATPTKSEGLPDQVFEVLIDPGTPDQTILVPETKLQPVIGRSGGLKGFKLVPTGRFLPRTIPGTPPKTETVRIPGVPASERVGTMFTRFGAGFEMQIFTRKSLFTFDISGDGNYYWDRPGPEQTDYNGSVLLNYLYRVTPRLQFSTQLNAAYLSQPDVGRINTPQSLGSDYVTGNWRTDLSYRWTPRVTSVLSFTDNFLFAIEKTAETSNYNDTVFGAEFRYLWNPRFTLIAEGRYSSIAYPANQTLDSHTAFLLLGAEVRLSNRLTGSVRVGESLRTFEETGEKATTPYLESSVAWRAGPGSVVSLSTRFGFEEPRAASEEQTVLRLGLSYAQAFSARLSAVANVNFLHQQTTTVGSDLTSTTDTFDTTLRLQYSVTRDFSVNASYTYTDLTTSLGFQDYYRNRFFIGGQYTF